MALPVSKAAAGSVGTVETRVPRCCRRRSRSTAARALHPVRIAYETYGTLSPARDNVILVCHALSGDAHAAGYAKTPPAESTRDGFARGGPRRHGRPWPGLVGRHDRPRQGLRHEPLLRRQHEPARRLPRHDRTVFHQPGDRQPVRIRFPGHHRRRHGAYRARVSDEIGISRLAAVAGGSLGGMQALEWAVLYPDQVDAIVVIASTHAVQPQGVAWNAIARNAIMARSRLAGRPLLRHGTRAERRDGRGAHGRPHHLSLRQIAWRQVRPPAAVCRRHPIHADRTGVRGGKLPASPGRHLRQAVRRQHVPVHVAGADVFRSRAAVWARFARGRAEGRLRADAAHRVQLGLALSAVRLRGARGGAARARQGRRASRHRRAVRARLLPARGSAPDADDSAVPRAAR